MGRSVNYLNNAQRILYLSFMENEEDEDLAQMYWGDFEEEVKSCFSSCPSLENPYSERWDNNETKIILENNLAEVGISEYCGLVSVSIQARTEENESLAINWIYKTWPGICKSFKDHFQGSMLTRLGTFSNGEGVFEVAK